MVQADGSTSIYLRPYILKIIGKTRGQVSQPQLLDMTSRYAISGRQTPTTLQFREKWKNKTLAESLRLYNLQFISLSCKLINITGDQLIAEDS
ncbi:hypothetical protein AVEN_109380-1 [Araneus ventricosus]|uniref:Uncharacterized protein n=1 Tax=Araneus ventricosus TaxID=182803 RepID=A0A4Y1ZNT6_ARAVE|nr:hypothetical protein AVEN_109380-1 [Araneus ventricosus]